MKVNTKTLAGIIVLAGLVVVFDYTMKYSGLKIPFPVPGLEFLTFDFTGVPIVLSLFLYGLLPSVFTSVIAVIAILARSGKIVSALMKGVAEFSTVLGMSLGFKAYKKHKKFGLWIAFAFGIVLRVVVMTIANFMLINFGFIAVPPGYLAIPLIYLSLIALFNVIQGCISMTFGFIIYAAARKRIPTLTENPDVPL